MQSLPSGCSAELRSGERKPEWPIFHFVIRKLLDEAELCIGVPEGTGPAGPPRPRICRSQLSNRSSNIGRYGRRGGLHNSTVRAMAECRISSVYTDSARQTGGHFSHIGSSGSSERAQSLRKYLVGLYSTQSCCVECIRYSSAPAKFKNVSRQNVWTIPTLTRRLLNLTSHCTSTIYIALYMLVNAIFSFTIMYAISNFLFIFSLVVASIDVCARALAIGAYSHTALERAF